MSEICELLESRELGSLYIGRAEPFMLEEVTNVLDCLLVKEVNELECLVLEELPVIAKVRVLINLINGINLQFSI